MEQLPLEDRVCALRARCAATEGKQPFGRNRRREGLPKLVREYAELAVALAGNTRHFARGRVPYLCVEVRGFPGLPDARFQEAPGRGGPGADAPGPLDRVGGQRPRPFAFLAEARKLAPDPRQVLLRHRRDSTPIDPAVG